MHNYIVRPHLPYIENRSTDSLIQNMNTSLIRTNILVTISCLLQYKQVGELSTTSFKTLDQTLYKLVCIIILYVHTFPTQRVYRLSDPKYKHLTNQDKYFGHNIREVPCRTVVCGTSSTDTIHTGTPYMAMCEGMQTIYTIGRIFGNM